MNDRRRTFLVILALVVLTLSAPIAFADQYCNSSATESAINTACLAGTATGPNGGVILQADDFEDGSFFVTTEDEASAPNDGWRGDPGTVPGDNWTASGGAVGSNTTARGGSRTISASPGGGGGSAFHFLAPSASVYDEIYFRYYVKLSSGYDFGHEKWVFFHEDTNASTELILLGIAFEDPQLIVLNYQGDFWISQNQGNDLTLVADHWYYIEIRIKLNTADNTSNGIVQLWTDDCGTSGLDCAGSGTLRLSRTDLCIRCTSNPNVPLYAVSLGAPHVMNYCSAPGMPCSGQLYYDQIIISTARVGPMGAAGDTTPPAVPTGVYITQATNGGR